MSEQTKCGLCGEPMPPGEEMFQYHGYSGPCPKPPAAPVQQEPVAWLIDENEPSEFVTRSANIGVHCKGQPLYTHPDSDLRAKDALLDSGSALMAVASQRIADLRVELAEAKRFEKLQEEALGRAEAERDSFRALLQEALNQCVDYMAIGYTHADWKTENAKELKSRIDPS